MRREGARELRRSSPGCIGRRLWLQGERQSGAHPATRQALGRLQDAGVRTGEDAVQSNVYSASQHLWQRRRQRPRPLRSASLTIVEPATAVRHPCQALMRDDQPDNARQQERSLIWSMVRRR